MYNIASRLVQYFDSPRARPYPLSLFLPLLNDSTRAHAVVPIRATVPLSRSIPSFWTYMHVSSVFLLCEFSARRGDKTGIFPRKRVSVFHHHMLIVKVNKASLRENSLSLNSRISTTKKYGSSFEIKWHFACCCLILESGKTTPQFS